MMNRALTVVACSCAALGILVSLAVLGSGITLFLAEAYPRIAEAVMMIFVVIGAMVTIVDVGIIVKMIRSWSWANVIIVALTIANIAMTGVLVFLFRFFSQPIAGTGA